MIILGIDTSQSASVALVDAESGEVLAAEAAADQRRHVEFIGPALQRVLAHPVSPELVVTGIGPGPFTGLRVGIAAGIAIGAARGIPVKGMLSHAALVEELRASQPLIEAVLVAGDARRREVYFSVYGPDADVPGAADAVDTPCAADVPGAVDAPGADAEDAGSDADGLGPGRGLGLLAGPFVARPADVAEVLHGAGFAGSRLPATRIGRGFALYPDILGAPNPETILDPKAECLAMAAARELAAGHRLPEPIPEYLREPDAKAAPVRESRLK